MDYPGQCLCWLTAGCTPSPGRYPAWVFSAPPSSCTLNYWGRRAALKRPRVATRHRLPSVNRTGVPGPPGEGPTTGRPRRRMHGARAAAAKEEEEEEEKEEDNYWGEDDEDSRGLMTDSVLEAKWKKEGETWDMAAVSCACGPTDRKEAPARKEEDKHELAGGVASDMFGRTAAEVRLREFGPYSTAGVATRIYSYVKVRKSMVDFLAWFQGDFDNYRQVLDDRERGLEPREGGGHEHIHCQLVPVESKKLMKDGDALIFAKYYFNGNPDIVFRQRLYKVFVESSGTSVMIEMRIYRLYKEVEEKIQGCGYELSKVDLSGEDLYTWLEGCEVYWRQEESEHGGLAGRGEHFIGYMDGGGCTVYSTEVGGMIRIEDDLVMTEQDLWVNDRGFDERGNFVYGNRRGIPYKMERVDAADETLAWTTRPGGPGGVMS